MKMADLIHLNYHILPIINRFGIYLGFGDKTIEQVCSQQRINTDFFLEVVNVFNDENYFPSSSFINFDLKDILSYLKKSHEYFISVKLKNIEDKIDNFIKTYSVDNLEKIELIRNFYLEYKSELIEHIKYEDEVIYPYVLWLANNKDKAIKESESPDFHISEYIDNHSNIEEKIFDLKNLIIKYLKLPSPNELSNEILFELFDFEKDIFDHQRLEEKVLIPKAMKIEEKIFGKNKL